MIELPDKYLEHFDKAEELLKQADSQAASAHAVLALSVVVDRLVYAIRETS